LRDLRLKGGDRTIVIEQAFFGWSIVSRLNIMTKKGGREMKLRKKYIAVIGLVCLF